MTNVNCEPAHPAFDTACVKKYLSKFICTKQSTVLDISKVLICDKWLSDADLFEKTIVLYRAFIVNRDHTTYEQQFVGKIIPDGKLKAEHKSALKKTNHLPSCGEPVIAIPELNLLLWVFPNDPKMKLITEERLQSLLNGKLSQVAQDLKDQNGWKIKKTSLGILRYVPARRFTADCLVKIHNEQTGEEREIRFIVKQLKDYKKAQKAFNDLVDLQQAWNHSEPVSSHEKLLQKSFLKNGRSVRFPLPKVYDKDLAAVVIESLPGEDLRKLLAQLDIKKTMQKVGELLADFHFGKIQIHKKVTIASELDEVAAVVQLIADLSPELNARAQSLQKNLQNFHWQNKNPEVLLHGSFRLNHIFIFENELSLIDMDSIRHGHPAYDIANMLSSLYYLLAQGLIDQNTYFQISYHFILGYANRSTVKIFAKSVIWFLASLLLNKQASKYITHDHDDRIAKLEKALVYAETVWTVGESLREQTTLSELAGLIPKISL